MTIAYWNERYEPLETLMVPVEDRAFYFGDAVYEVIKVYGRKLWLLAEHAQRLRESLQKIAITTVDVDRIVTDCLQNVAENQVENGLVYVQVSRGTAPRNHAFPANARANVLIYSKETQDIWAPFRGTGIKVTLEPEIRWQRRDIKTVNLLANCLAKQQAESQGAQEAIFVEADGTITEASANNVFIVKEGVIRTAPAGPQILDGVTRRYVLSVAQRLGFKTETRAFSKADLLAADEVFITGTSSEVLGVSHADGKPVGKGGAKVVRSLREAFTADVKAFAAAAD
jgi:D-alanine transaminase